MKAKVQIWVGAGSQRKLVWGGQPLPVLPRVGEDVFFKKMGAVASYRVERINHFLDNGVIDIYVR